MAAWATSFFGRRMIIFLLTGVITPLMLKWGVPVETVNWLIGLAGTAILGMSAGEAARNFGVTTPPPTEIKK